MSVSKLAAALAVVTFGLLLLGGVVHATGSSLACPDWPLCYGEVFPEMVGGVAIEHSHRLVAAAVGLLTVALVVLAMRRRVMRGHAATALGLVIVQGALGGITVLYRLPLLVSTAHLAASLVFFALLLWIALRSARVPSLQGLVSAGAARSLRPWALFVTCAVYMQSVLGAFVRHTGSGVACGTDVALCLGELWPSSAAGRLQMAHRLAALAVTALALSVSVRAMRVGQAEAMPRLRVVAWSMAGVVLLQAALGAVSVATSLGVASVSAHLGGGAVLLGLCVALCDMAHARPSNNALIEEPATRPIAGEATAAS